MTHPEIPGELHGRRVQPGRKLEIRVADAAPSDEFASHKTGPCVDSAGAHWPAHDYSRTGPRGVRCRRCDWPQAMEAIP